jgi:hypothetical protein
MCSTAAISGGLRISLQRKLSVLSLTTRSLWRTHPEILHQGELGINDLKRRTRSSTVATGGFLPSRKDKCRSQLKLSADPMPAHRKIRNPELWRVQNHLAAGHASTFEGLNVPVGYSRRR